MSIPEAYPIGYRLGLDMLLWYINIFASLSISLIFLIRTIQVKFINKKKLYLGDFFVGLGIVFTHIFFQMAYTFPMIYNIFVSSGYVSTYLGITIFVYFWERNVIKLKFIPTIISFILTCFAIINLVYNLTFHQHLIEFISILIPLGGIVVYLALIVILLQFSQRIIDNLKYIGYLVIVSIVSYAIGYTFDTYFIFELFPNFPPIISPIVVLISTLIFFYGINKISEGLLSYYQKSRTCIVHKGKILHDDLLYLCPHCNAIYCKNCYEQVIKNEGCWNCFELFKMQEESKKEHLFDDSKSLNKK
ncbi:MAG: hypothetical protein ACFFBP_06915 [Promethearchaeota archaeon]